MRSAALIVALTVVAYWPALRAGFVFDDAASITDNRLVQARDGLYRSWLTTEAADYYPLTWSLWWLEWRLWGNNAMGYHVVNVLLHAANAVLVWMILQRLKTPGAWLAALVFAVHPVNVATVAWVSEQKTTLSMLFFAGAVLWYLRFDEEGRWRWYGFSLAAFLLALLAKSAVVMLPVVLLGCVWWTRGQVRGKDFLRLVPFFVLALVLGLVTIWFQHHRASLGRTIQTAGFASRLTTAGWVPWFYLWKALWPVELSVVYPKWNVGAVPGIILVSGFVILWWKRATWGRPLLFGLGYFVVMLVPVLGFVDQAFYRVTLVADHWQYYAIVGVIALAAVAGDRRRAVGAMILIVLSVGTWKRSGVYASDEALWRDTIAKNPTAWLAHNNLGFALAQAGRLRDAVGRYEQALLIKPDYAEAHNNLGAALARLGELPEAMGHYERALQLEPEYATAHYNLGTALWQAGRGEDAVSQYEQALRIKPDYAEAHNNLGVALTQAGRLQEAIAQYEQALRLNPDYFEAHNNLAVALERAGHVREAIAHYEQALRIKPGDNEAQNSLTQLRSVQ